MESKYDYVVFDIETTGLHPESDQICEIAAIGVKDGLPQGLFSTLVAIEGSICLLYTSPSPRDTR